MAGLGRRLGVALLSIPVQNFLSKRLEGAWRATTGTAPPTADAMKHRKQEVKQAKKAGEPIPDPDEPALADTLMWAALSAMAIVLVRVVAERGAEEAHRWITGRNPSTADRNALLSSGESGKAQGLAALAVRPD